MQLIGSARDSGGGDADMTGGASAPRRSGGPATGSGSGTAGRKNTDDFEDDIPF
jgi:hypothetical protein